MSILFPFFEHLFGLGADFLAAGEEDEEIDGGHGSDGEIGCRPCCRRGEDCAERNADGERDEVERQGEFPPRQRADGFSAVARPTDDRCVAEAEHRRAEEPLCPRP